jgi:O-antigen/teichoic acid export membrane protein
LLKKIHHFSKRPFIRNVATVAGGTVASHAILIAFSPLITRLYGAAAYGILGVFMFIVVVMGAIAAMTYPVAIVLPKSDAEAAGLARLSIWAFVSGPRPTLNGLPRGGTNIMPIVGA